MTNGLGYDAKSVNKLMHLNIVKKFDDKFYMKNISSCFSAPFKYIVLHESIQRVQLLLAKSTTTKREVETGPIRGTDFVVEKFNC